MLVDAVITNLELQLESRYSPYGHFIALRFIDTYPTFPKINNNVKVIDYNYDYEVITEESNLDGLDIVRH